MESDSHPIRQQIIAVQLPCDSYGNPQDWVVGRNCTRIEGSEKNGEYCMIPYIRVWAADFCIAEFCQHKASFVQFGDFFPQAEAKP